MEALNQKYSEFKQADDARNKFIEGLLQKMTDMQKMMDRNPFTLVLIDGDCMNVGLEGGDEAVKRLRLAVWNELRYATDFNHDQKIVIRVYANLRGLSKIYADYDILSTSDVFAQFVLGFNKAHPLCDFADAGNHKEAADKKIQEIFSLHAHDVHCKHIIFGASGDASYSSFLNSFDDSDVLSRVRLLKGPPFPFEFNSILSKAKMSVFEDVFRDRPLWAPTRKRPYQSQDDPQTIRTQTPGALKVGHAFTGSSSMTWRREENPESNALVVASHRNNGDSNDVARPFEDVTQYQNHSSSFTHWPSDETVPKDMTGSPQIVAFPRSIDIDAVPILATNEQLAETPKALDFGSVKQRAAQRLGQSIGFWGPLWDRPDDNSKNVIKWAVEDWIERTNNPPPRNATWLLQYFPDRVPPSTILRDPSLQEWRISGGDEWVNIVDQLVQAQRANTPPSSNHRIYQNSFGQRIDVPPAIIVPLAVVFDIRSRRPTLCNTHYLLGRCANEKCTHEHGATLNEIQLQALQYLSRTNRCAFGVHCQNVICLRGHICPYGKPCRHGPDCVFAETHDIDTVVVPLSS